MPRSAQRPAGIVPLVGFFAFGTLMSGIAAVALLFPGSVLEGMWRLNREARPALLSLGSWAIAIMVAVCLACAASAVGLWIGARWGQRTAVAVLAVNLVGDTANALFRSDLRTLIGLPIAVLLIAYLLSAPVKMYCQPESQLRRLLSGVEPPNERT